MVVGVPQVMFGVCAYAATLIKPTIDADRTIFFMFGLS
jgi:hypothetical protein